MKTRSIFIALFVMAIVLSSCTQKSEVKSLSNANDSVSYAIGVSFGTQMFQSENLDSIIDSDALIQGVRDVMEEEDLLITNEEGQEFLNSFFESIQKAQMEKQSEQVEEEFGGNIEISRAFLEANKTKPGVVTTASGLQYKIIKKGNGPKPQVDSKVKVHYHGTLIDGTVFDSSVERAEPVEFGVTQVIRGWTEALLLMPLGSKWELYIPGELAYGANPRPGGVIQPYMALVFEVELLEIK